MAENSVVRARIDEATKAEAAVVLAAMGLSLSDAFRLLLKRVAAEKALPFEPLVANAQTVAAMKAARRGDIDNVGKDSRLLASLNADCYLFSVVSKGITGAKSRGGMARSWTAF